MILTSPSGNFEASNLDNTLDLINRGFLIIEHLDQIDDFQNKILLIDRMKSIVHNVISRMMNDHIKCEPFSEKAIGRFDIN